MAAADAAERSPCQWCTVSSSVQQVAARVDATEAWTKDAVLRFDQLLEDQAECVRFRAAISKQTEQLSKSLAKGNEDCSRCCTLVAECQRRMDDVVTRLGELNRVVAAHHEEAVTRLNDTSRALSKRVTALDSTVAEHHREALKSVEDVRQLVGKERSPSRSASKDSEGGSRALHDAANLIIESKLETALAEALQQVSLQVDQGTARVSEVAEKAARDLSIEVSECGGKLIAQLREELQSQMAAESSKLKKVDDEEVQSELHDALHRLRQEFNQQLDESLEEARASLAAHQGVLCVARADFETVIGEWKGGLFAIQELLATVSETRWRERQREWAEEHARVVGALKSAASRVQHLEQMAQSKEELGFAKALLGQAWTDLGAAGQGRTGGPQPAWRPTGPPGPDRSAKSVGARLHRASSVPSVGASLQTPPPRLKQGLRPNWT